MDTFTRRCLSVLLGWIELPLRWLWSLVDGNGQSGYLIWILAAVAVCVVGIVVDLLIRHANNIVVKDAGQQPVQETKPAGAGRAVAGVGLGRAKILEETVIRTKVSAEAPAGNTYVVHDPEPLGGNHPREQRQPEMQGTLRYPSIGAVNPPLLIDNEVIDTTLVPSNPLPMFDNTLYDEPLPLSENDSPYSPVQIVQEAEGGVQRRRRGITTKPGSQIEKYEPVQAPTIGGVQTIHTIESLDREADNSHRLGRAIRNAVSYVNNSLAGENPTGKEFRSSVNRNDSFYEPTYPDGYRREDSQ